MKEEHEEILDKMREFFINYNDILDDDFYRRRLEFDNYLEILAKTQDTEVLEHLLDFFDEEFDCEVDEVCEHLRAKIGANFTQDQLIEAFYKKFDIVAGNYLGICRQMCMWCILSGYFEQFRKMFNAVKSKHSAKVLDKLKAYFDCGREHGWEWTDEEKNMVYTLEEDMKKWQGGENMQL
ncbi:MAG: hypothetical protein LBJ75_01555 [Puniceicoccales bacterium]|jgi:hypothetical protein|nr:hypothetical protein [Puniceicoccales bacterium]